MSALTKEKALEKMSGFRVKIGYPDEWKDYAALELAADAPYYSNARAAQMFEHERMLARIDAPVDRERWFMAPQQVNAYYHPMLNEIVFPAAILQPPFFDPAADPAVNFGAIGAVIGHEITHGFDDQGRKYDASGNMNDWWQPADADQFNARAAVIVKQANDTVVHTQDEECEERKAGPFSLSKFGVRSVLAKDCTCRNVNGELTQGENIADLGGLRLAYRAWGEYVKTNGADGGHRRRTTSRRIPRNGSSSAGRRYGGRTSPPNSRPSTSPSTPTRRPRSGSTARCPTCRSLSRRSTSRRATDCSGRTRRGWIYGDSRVDRPGWFTL